MKLGIMQPYFLPYIGYWQLIACVDKFVIYDDVTFIKGGWINRNRYLYQGEAKYFNIIMDGASSYKKINEINLTQDGGRSRKKLLSTISMAYKKVKLKLFANQTEEDVSILNIEKWDSVAHMGLISELEEAFDIMFDTDDIINFTSYTCGIDLLKKYGIEL